MEKMVGFLSIEPTQDEKGFIGAILVTDDLGMPQEFRVTYPVKPTNLQKRLYGDSLDVHIGVTLCGEPLHRALQSKPELLLVKQKTHLPIAERVSSKVAYVERVGEAIIVGEEGNTSQKSNIRSKSERFQPINIFFSNGDGQQIQEEITALVEEFFQNIDLLEPYERIRGALEALAQQDERFR